MIPTVQKRLCGSVSPKIPIMGKYTEDAGIPMFAEKCKWSMYSELRRRFPKRDRRENYGNH